MGKKRIVDMVTVSIEDRLESNGALRNVAVNDAWKRLRQNIDVKSWKMADGVLQELSNSLQKINMLKSMTALFTKLRQAFQNPELMVDEGNYVTMDPHREAQKPAPTDDHAESTVCKDTDAERESTMAKEAILGLKTTLQQIRSSLESTGSVPEQLDTSRGVSEDVKACHDSLVYVCEKCRKWNRDIEHVRKRLENSEIRNKDLEKQLDDKEETLDRMKATVDALEKKHVSMKEDKLEGFKDQMKYKSLERQVDLKAKELTKLKDENKDLKDRVTAMQTAKSDTGELLNPFPPSKLVEKYTELFNKEWKDAFDYYKTTPNMTEADVAKRLLDMLQDCFAFCTETSTDHLHRLASDLLAPGDNTNMTLSISRLDETEVKQMQNLRKLTCKASCEFAKSSFITLLESGNQEKYSFQEITDTMPYIEKSVEVCWFLALQTPPLHINFADIPATGTDIDTDRYDVSACKGSKVEFVTWPTLHAWKDGDILRKGFLQAN